MDGYAGALGEARFRGFANETVTLQTKDGKVHDLPLALLSAAAAKAMARKEAKSLIKELSNPKPLTVDAAEAFTVARALYREGLFEECDKELTAFWKKNPRDSGAWALQSETVGFKLGFPCVYPALILLSDAVAWPARERQSCDS